MLDLLVAAIPAFILLMAVEALSYRHLVEEAREHAHEGYELRDTRTSISMGLGYLVISGGWNAVALVAFAALATASPWEVDMGQPWAWVVLLVLFDLLFYWDHRVHHRVRVGWASHVVHHSSEHFNLSTAVRQPWTPMSSTVFFAPLPLLGFPPSAVLTISAIDLLYQFGIHTEKIGRLPRPIEFLFNTPSHHRVHHGSDQQYLDRNYGGVFIVFDRLFGTFTPETARPTYGLTSNINTFNPLRVAFHEWQAIGHDVRQARRWRDRLGYALGPPGWRPAGGGGEPPSTAATSESSGPAVSPASSTVGSGAPEAEGRPGGAAEAA
ncbi:MAG: sterol desaturase family protein [Patulibacter minatonensis]